MPLKAVNGERRQKARRRPPRLIYVELGAINGGMMRDLSEEGFALRAMMPVSPAQTTPFSFQLTPAVRAEGEGEVVWTEDKGRVAGIRFTKISAHLRSQIQAWVSEELEAPETHEGEPDAPASAAQSFDELRDELRSGAPPREPAPFRAAELSSSVHAEKPPEAESESAPTGPETAESSPVAPRRMFQTFPRFLGTGNTGNGANDAPGGTPPPWPLRAAPTEKRPGHWPTSVTPATEPEPESPEDASSHAPDIANILIQPPSKVAERMAQAPVLEPLDFPNRGGREGRGFTLSRAMVIMVVLALIATGAVYRQRLGEGFIWVGQQLSGTPNQAEPPAPNSDAANAEGTKPETTKPDATQPAPNEQQSQAPANAVNSPNTTSAPKSTENQRTASESATHPANSPQSSVPSIPQGTPPPVTPLSGMSQEQGNEAGADSGAVEYAKAMELLHGKNGNVDAPEAVRLLWLSVEKGNPSAELSLAELYWRGEGVARNCDQTRILLSAAARKGDPEAQKKLQQFRREGCE